MRTERYILYMYLIRMKSEDIPHVSHCLIEALRSEFLWLLLNVHIKWTEFCFICLIPSESTSLIMSANSASVGLCPMERIMEPSSLVIIKPSPSLSNILKAFFNTIRQKYIYGNPYILNRFKSGIVENDYKYKCWLKFIFTYLPQFPLLPPPP